MTKLMTIAAAAAGLMLAASAASALDEKKIMYVTGEGPDRMVMGGDLTEGAPVLAGTDGSAPADCPDGSFYEGANNMIIACGDGGPQFMMTKAAAAAMAPSGEPLPEGAMVLEPHEGN